MSDCQRPNRPESLPPEHIPRVEELQTVSVLFKQLSDASRLRIFWLLCHCEACGTELSAIVEMTPPAVAHHLRLLRSSHLLVSRREERGILPGSGYRPGPGAPPHDRGDGGDLLSPGREGIEGRPPGRKNIQRRG